MRLLLAAALAVTATCGSAVSFSSVVDSEWETFKAQHGKYYQTPQEEKFRFKIYLENKNKIAKHNLEAARGQHTYTLGMNKFGDMLNHEVRAMMNGFTYKPDMPRNGATYIPPHNVVVPESMDWRTKGAVTPVKNQKECGSCWAFSATGSLEGQHFRKTGKLVSLSEQNLVDCSIKEGNNGCEGGLMTQAFKYVSDNGGIDTEAGYPYKATDGHCHYTKAAEGATDTGYTDIPRNSEKDLESAVATVGPISIAIDAALETFTFYKDGIYNPGVEACDPTDLDHGVLAVGYGSDSGSGEKYWIVKNSWGEGWGKQGYIWMIKDSNNTCGVASMATYPNV